ncbi:Hypothetical predicted protein [Mytilus galloprovincialis]|uniref:Fucolectin tachylectin-4 pentraxin-1 domain-containing protein n=1 Tax=Mytilus galloprovincialis TaxID=29158 RepID=A0A8B6C859_MYTGA|nr:Hypothetical predicted protein [Mytilus galloprovincialis]
MKVRELDRKVDSCTLKAKIAKLEECIEIIENKDKAPDTSTSAPVEKSNVTSGSCGKKNLALNKKCGQSSHDGCGAGVDGNFNSYMHTTYFYQNNDMHGESNPYWWVDIGSSCMVKLIKIYNRRDCCGQRLRNLEVSIGMSLSSMQVCGYYKGPGSNGEMIPISCREPIEARYVKVMIKDENTLDTILNFAEIQVFS